MAERFGVSVHAIRKRITKEKWTKRDYAAALEARGLTAPERPKPLNVAERFAANYSPPVAAGEPEHPFEELVAALKEATAAVKSGDEGAVLAGEAPDPALLERRALAQALTALTKGRASDAKAFASLSEQMRKRVSDEQRSAEEAEAAEAAAAAEEKRSREADLIGRFRYAMHLAYCMVHNPKGAPAIFIDSVAAVRREAFGEGDEESLAAARQSAEASRRQFGLDEAAWQEALAMTSRDAIIEAARAGREALAAQEAGAGDA